MTEIKLIEEIASQNSHTFNHALNFWHHNLSSAVLKLACKDKIQRDELHRELITENSIAKAINQDKNYISEQTTKCTQLRDLEKQETALKTDIENIVHRMQKLKSTHDESGNSKTKRKLKMQSNFAAISKKLTGTSFEYQGPNISGFVTNRNTFQVFDLNPNKFNEQSVSKYIWKCLTTASNADWLDVLNSDV